MMITKPRRHPLQTFQFWFFILMGLATLAAWKLELVAFGPQRDKLPVAEDEPLPAPSGAVDGPLRKRNTAVGKFAQAPLPDAPPVPEEGGFRDFGIRSADYLQDEAPRPGNVVQTANIGASRREYKIDDAPPQRPASDWGQTALAKPALPEPSPGIDMAEFERLQQAGDDISAHRLLSTWYWEHPDQRSQFLSQINGLAEKIYFRPSPHYGDPCRVQPGETLDSIARECQVPTEYLVKLNGLTTTRVIPGQSLKVIQGPFRAVIDLSDYELTILAHGYYVTSMPIGVGMDHPISRGNFRLANKVNNPDYTSPGGTISRNDDTNPYGEFWLPLTDANGAATPYGLHGAPDESGIGKIAGLGCLRVSNTDAAFLCDLLINGADVLVRE